MARLASKSRLLYRRASRAIPGGVNSPVRYYPPYPMFVAEAEGSKFRTVDGEEYLDYCMAYGALIDGHAGHEVVEAVQNAVGKGSIYGQPTEAEVELAETISSLVPSMQVVRLVNSGTEATMHALRLARGFTGRNKILKFEGGFHGSHDSVLVKPGPRGSIVGRPSSEGIPGPILPANGFLESLRRLTRENRVVLIFDEVITGFRLSLGGAQDYYHIIPDLTILGKIVGGGFPLAAFGGRREIMRKLSPLGPVYQAGTFSGNPVSVTAGLTTLRSLKRRSNRIYPRLERLGGLLSNGIRDHLASQKVSAQTSQVGSMFQTFFTSRKVTDYNSAKSSDVNTYNRYFRSLLELKVFVPPSQLESCFLSTAHGEAEIEQTLDSIGESLRSLRG